MMTSVSKCPGHPDLSFYLDPISVFKNILMIWNSFCLANLTFSNFLVIFSWITVLKKPLKKEIPSLFPTLQKLVFSLSENRKGIQNGRERSKYSIAEKRNIQNVDFPKQKVRHGFKTNDNLGFVSKWQFKIFFPVVQNHHFSRKALFSPKPHFLIGNCFSWKKLINMALG